MVLTDVSPRDGIEREPFISTDLKTKLVDAVAKAHFPQVECTAFGDLSPFRQFCDAKLLARQIKRKTATKYFVSLAITLGFLE